MPVKLSTGTIDEVSLRRQKKDFDSFVKWAAEQGHDILALVEADAADTVLNIVVEYGQSLFDDDEGKMYWFRNTIAYVSRMKRQWVCKYAWDALRRWEVEEPGEARSPTPPLVFLAYVGLALSWEWHDTALAIAALYDAALRPGELLSKKSPNVKDERRVLWGDLVFPEDAFGGAAQYVLLRIKKPKTRAASRAAARQVGRFTLTQVIEWLRAERRARGSAADQRVIRLSYRQVVERFHALSAALDLEMFSFTLGSLRAGRATAEFERHGSMDQCRTLLRHVSVSTTDVYVQELNAARAAMQLSPTQKSLVGRAARAGVGLLDVHLANLEEAAPAQRFTVDELLFL